MKIHLKKKELVAIERDASGLTVSCLDGAIWLTQNGRSPYTPRYEFYCQLQGKGCHGRPKLCNPNV